MYVVYVIHDLRNTWYPIRENITYLTNRWRLSQNVRGLFLARLIQTTERISNGLRRLRRTQ